MILEIDDKKVFVSDAGQGIDKDKDTIVLLHGSGLSHIVWSLTEKYLSNQNYNVLAIDLPGHGNSEGKSLRSIAKISLISLEELIIFCTGLPPINFLEFS